MSFLGSRFRAATGGLPPLFWTLWAGMLVNRLASFVITFLALFLVHDRGFSADQAGQVVAIYGFGMLLAAPLGGALTDRIGRRHTMLLGLGLGGACVAVLGFLSDPRWLTLVAFLAALSGDLYRPAAQAAVADVVAPADRARAYGLIYWAINLGFAISLAVAGFVAERSMLALFLADALTSLTFALIVLARVPETRPVGLAHAPPLQGLLRVFRDGPYLVFLGLHLATLLVFTQFQLAMPLDFAAHGVGPRAFSLIMALNGLGVVVLQPLLGPWLPRHDGARVLAASVLCIGVGFGLNFFGGSIPAYVLGAVFYTVGEVLGFPVASAFVADLAPAELRGRYQGAFSMSWGLAFTLSPLLGGQLLHRYGGGVLWPACLATCLVVAALHLAAGPSRRRRLAIASRDMVEPR